MTYLCDACAAELVRKGVIKPHAAVFGRGEIRYHSGPCGRCQQFDSCVDRPDVRNEARGFIGRTFSAPGAELDTQMGKAAEKARPTK